VPFIHCINPIVQVTGLRPGRSYAFRVTVTPQPSPFYGDVPPQPHSPAAAFSTQPTAPEQPPPARLVGRARNFLKVRRAPASGISGCRRFLVKCVLSRRREAAGLAASGRRPCKMSGSLQTHHRAGSTANDAVPQLRSAIHATRAGGEAHQLVHSMKQGMSTGHQYSPFPVLSFPAAAFQVAGATRARRLANQLSIRNQSILIVQQCIFYQLSRFKWAEPEETGGRQVQRLQPELLLQTDTSPQRTSNLFYRSSSGRSRKRRAAGPSRGTWRSACGPRTAGRTASARCVHVFRAFWFFECQLSFCLPLLLALHNALHRGNNKTGYMTRCVAHCWRRTGCVVTSWCLVAAGMGDAVRRSGQQLQAGLAQARHQGRRQIQGELSHTQCACTYCAFPSRAACAM